MEKETKKNINILLKASAIGLSSYLAIKALNNKKYYSFSYWIGVIALVSFSEFIKEDNEVKTDDKVKTENK